MIRTKLPWSDMEPMLIFRGVLEISISSQIIFEIEKNLPSLTPIIEVRTPIAKAIWGKKHTP